MKRINKRQKRIIFAAVFAAVGMICFGSPRANAATEPEIVGQEAVIYMDGRDEISVFGGEIRSVTYSSGATNIATVSDSGVVTPISQGTADIRASVTYSSGEDGALKTKELSYKLTVIDSSDNYFVYKNGVICGLTEKGKALKDVYVPGYHGTDRITAVSENAFDNNNTVERVFLSDCVEYMDYYDWGENANSSSVFDGCSRLQEIHLGKNLKSFGYLVGISSMKKITVHPENQNFVVKDNVLLSNNHLVYYPAGKEEQYYVVPEDIEYIDAYAFSGAKNIQRVNFPEDLKSIGRGAFEKSVLTEVRIPLNTNVAYRAFYSCDELEKALLPNNMPKNRFSFEKCTALKNVVLPRTATQIFGNNFSGCSSLENFQIADGEGGSGEEIDLEEGNLEVEDGVVFRRYGWISRVLLLYPQGKKETKYSVPDGVDTIMNEAFYGAACLKKVVLPDSMRNIWGDAFAYCSSLQSLHLPKKTYIAHGEKGYFPGCKSLEKITVASANDNFSSIQGVLYNKGKNYLYAFPQGKKVKKFTVPKSVINISRYSFADNRYLQEISAGKNVRIIRKNAFENAKSLKSITLYSKVKEIGEAVFKNCKNLQKIVLPNNVSVLDKGLFSGCKMLGNVVIGKSVKNIKEDVFRDCIRLRTVTFKGKKWMKDIAFDTVFLNAGSKNYSKLTVKMPKCTKKEKSTCRKVLKAAGLHKKAKIKFAK